MLKFLFLLENKQEIIKKKQCVMEWDIVIYRKYILRNKRKKMVHLKMRAWAWIILVNSSKEMIL